jgi:hypothetical protein
MGRLSFKNGEGEEILPIFETTLYKKWHFQDPPIQQPTYIEWEKVDPPVNAAPTGHIHFVHSTLY